ncbi:Na+/H+ antiporter NhaC family protein [Tepidibacter hydrothermalis]|uniref:Na+/H+ antiporter NhaC family protein n=1 Tax=Tepidibacter hydrothermalis TaxID=3036126 RepID=A0ABY8ECM9_9FIRM|nr:Na+/H+ antiporter NhaC family protein [Tepidibacter hydrothermalis]WFD10676.1 Na+/H+ antiporter NhaC family protein [Tepidibacter hydrothermalis]
MNKKSGNPWALLPLAVFLIIFIGSGIITNDFYKMPVIVAFLISAAVALFMNPKESISNKIDVFCKGAGDSNIILMAIIFILAGAFGNVAKEMGGVDATVNLSLSILPENLLIVGLFVIACFISFSMGTSVGTIVALAPIAIGVAEKLSIPVGLALGAVVGGGMFGDNLSMISDTTIAAIRTQGCEMRDKFKVNFIITLPAAIITAVILGVITSGNQLTLDTEYTYEIVKVLPYLSVLVAALFGVNVFIILGGGILFAGAVGLYYKSFGVFGFIQAVATGISGMEDLAMIAIIVGGVVELIKFNGGIQFILEFIRSRIKTKKGAEFGIAAIVSIVDICTANNTIAIVMAGPIAKDIAAEYDIDPRRSASILDIFAASCQGLIPYGAQILIAAGLASISPLAIMKYLHYPILIFAFGIIAISFGYPNLEAKAKKASEVVS